MGVRVRQKVKGRVRTKSEDLLMVIIRFVFDRCYGWKNNLPT